MTGLQADLEALGIRWFEPVDQREGGGLFVRQGWRFAWRPFAGLVMWMALVLWACGGPVTMVGRQMTYGVWQIPLWFHHALCLGYLAKLTQQLAITERITLEANACFLERLILGIPWTRTDGPLCWVRVFDVVQTPGPAEGALLNQTGDTAVVVAAMGAEGKKRWFAFDAHGSWTDPGCRRSVVATREELRDDIAEWIGGGGGRNAGRGQCNSLADSGRQ
ncbi:MAG: hypothetical protein HN742_28300 [Lentisphaerae bacterium]|nr:hypothetical protein [Lentisphaerota bacterium]MBT4821691.1 hypothetical protein [Lentisphaerota bacterium]MBT5612602.1 hypothetical protein [Lentisphaerota bacterium]MBT7059261.1 hypothetical protein [Lentisphaerota bacterium]MBT7845808.1 hypothetical protein [Lentisphaerota bacterium]